MSSPKPVAVVGAGISGLVLGRALRSRGIPVVLYERVKSGVPRHLYSLTLYPWAYEPLLKLLDIDLATFWQKVAVAKPSFAAPEQPSPFRVNRAKFEGLLREGLSITGDHNLNDVRQDETGVTLSFDAEQPVQSALLVAADGPLSQVRRSLVPQCKLKVNPFAVMNGKAYAKEKPVTSCFDGVTELETRHGDTLLQIYVNSYDEAKLNLSFTYSRPARNDIDPLYKPNRPIAGATDIPEEYYEELSGLKNLDQPFKTIFEPEEVRRSRSLHWLMRSALIAQADALSLAERGVFFVGDALHATPILGSTGANMAITDALELGACLAESTPPPEFFSQRYHKWKQHVEAGEERLVMMHKGSELSSL